MRFSYSQANQRNCILPPIGMRIQAGVKAGHGRDGTIDDKNCTTNRYNCLIHSCRWRWDDIVFFFLEEIIVLGIFSLIHTISNFDATFRSPQITLHSLFILLFYPHLGFNYLLLLHFIIYPDCRIRIQPYARDAWEVFIHASNDFRCVITHSFW